MYHRAHSEYSTEIDLNLLVSRSAVSAPSTRRRPDGPAIPPHGADLLARLAPREREIASIVYANGMLSAEEARRHLVKPLSNSAIRSMLTRLEAKGVLRKRKVGNRYLFGPAVAGQKLREEALRRLCDDYFGGSPLDAALALVAMADERDALPRRRRGEGAGATPDRLVG
ncbi:MAG TPA: BlaI/MecI/CopY family transcriptional regulator [Allosphingosinicella sp.]|jgi:predicted transcriptional regulator